MAATVVGGAVGVALAAYDPSNPPYPADPNALSTIHIYDASTGAAVTGGSNDTPLSNYYFAADADYSPGHTKATLSGYLAVSGQQPGDFSGMSLGAGTTYPVKAAPAPVNGFGTRPVAKGGTTSSMAALAQAYPNTATSSSDFYELYQLRVNNTFPAPPEATYAAADIQIDTTAGTWKVVRPVDATATPTATPTATSTPTATPTDSPTATPTATPTDSPTASPTTSPTASPTTSPTASPTTSPTASPTTSPTATTSPTSTPTGSRFTPISPVRLLDTRSGLGARRGVVPSLGYVDVTVTGANGVPNDAAAVVLNVTAVGASTVTNIRVYPTPVSGNAVPTVSNLNLVKGQDRADLVTVKVGSGGKVRLYSAGGRVDLLADLAGFYSADGTVPAGSSAYHPIAPVRLLDTRSTGGAIPARSTRDLVIAGTNGVPADATSVVLGVTAATATAKTNLRTYPVPTDGSVPTVSTLNLSKADGAVPNLAVVKLGQGGAVRFFNSAGQTNVLADLYGYYDTSGAGGQVFHALDPERYLDTRTDDGGPLGARETADLTIASDDPNESAVPTSATAVALTLTGVDATQVTNVRVYPATVSNAVPSVSSLNLLKGSTSADAALVGLSNNGVRFFNSAGDVDLLADVAGWFGPASSS